MKEIVTQFIDLMHFFLSDLSAFEDEKIFFFFFIVKNKLFGTEHTFNRYVYMQICFIKLGGIEEDRNLDGA